MIRHRLVLLLLVASLLPLGATAQHAPAAHVIDLKSSDGAGMGEVYRARDTRLNRNVAFRVPPLRTFRATLL